jgi:ankyrin repeat protein
LVQRHGPTIATATNASGLTALHIASPRCGHLNVVQFLCQHAKSALNINAVDKEGLSALHHATQNGFLEIVKCLVQQEGIDVEVTAPQGTTPLIVAAVNNHLDIMKCLIQDGHANINAACAMGLTALHTASFANHFAVVQYLVSQKTTRQPLNVEAVDYQGMTALHFARAPKDTWRLCNCCCTRDAPMSMPRRKMIFVRCTWPFKTSNCPLCTI